MNNLNKDKSWIEVAKYDELPVNSGKTVRFKEKELAIFRLTNGKILAIENRCPHKDGVLAEGIVSGEYVFCPLHDRKIDLSSGLVQKPDTGCVKTFDVFVQNGKVYIALLEKSGIAS
ncbi:nitrite reductase small subunit NirD [Chengkuizengella marina]|uniref:Nitrite reductase small subunit NirD n=1 Tax=Chengkuizengella marina TaxID=2507566 RepID=A0A6N9Q5I7_9BACL|nr:nitrite reductase small subunit NirD [Chengkuizengella marina]NBI30125.1 nitrite reductase small subunit NirD [Chengkuizengella marina]